MHDNMKSHTDSPIVQNSIARSSPIPPQSISSNSPSPGSPEFLYAAFDSIDEPIGIKDINHQWVWVNEAFCRLTGRSREQWVGKSDRDVFGSDSATLFWQRDEMVLEEGIASLYEETITDADGNLHFFSTKRSLGRDTQGNPLVVATFREIEQNPNDRTFTQSQYDRELREQYQWLKWAIDRLPQAIFWKNHRSVYLGCNRKFSQMVKLPNPEDIIGKTDRDLPWKTEDVETIRRWDTRIIEHQISESHRLEFQPLSEEARIFLHLHQMPLRDLSGQAIGILGTVEDVTDRKQIDKALLDYHNEFLTLFKAMQDVILVFDREGCYLRIVPTNTDLLYKPEAELIGKTLHDVFPSDTADQFLDSIQQTLSSQKTTNIEYNLLLDGEPVWFEASITPLRENEAIWVARDITQRKQAELSKEETQQRLQAILDYAPIAIFIKDLDDKYLTINHLTQRILNVKPEELLGKTDSDLFPEEIARKFQQHDRQAIEHDTPITLEHEISISDRTYTYLTIKFPLKNHAGETYAIGTIATDITDRKIAEDRLQQKTKQLETTLLELRQTQSQLIQTEKMSSLGQLVAGIAHEINNPINFIHANLSHAQMYIEDLFSLVKLYQEKVSSQTPEIQEKLEEMDWNFVLDDAPKLLGSMQVGTQRIRNIVRSLRTFSRLDETGIKRVNVHEGIDSTLMMLQYRLTPKPGCPEIQVMRDYGELPVLECDAGQLNQVFLNILTNAIDALDRVIVTPEDAEPTISIRTEVLEDDRIAIHMANNGPEIPEDIQQRLFDPFFTTKPVGKGTGIGLSISYQIVTERHGGSLECVSAPGQGAEFTIELPIRQMK
ncbi:MAG: PAS domain-containing protein [Geitlerinemataceae cyanobacterium]